MKLIAKVGKSKDYVQLQFLKFIGVQLIQVTVNSGQKKCDSD